MPYFGRTSTERLYAVKPPLVNLFQQVVKTYDCTILCGHRGKIDQNKAFNSEPQRSKLKWPDGPHNEYPSKAVDAAPWPVNWEDTKRFYHFAGYVQGVAKQMDIPIRWGGDWDKDFDLNDQTFNDLVHFELVQ